jgi:hypothetical protein
MNAAESVLITTHFALNWSTHMTRHWSNVLGLTIAAGIGALTGTAFAADIDADDISGACHLSGTMSVHDDETRWSVSVSDLRGEGYGCYARVVIERSARSDSEVRSFKTHGDTQNIAFNGSRRRTQTTAATLYLCVDGGEEGDDCTEVLHAEEN